MIREIQIRRVGDDPPAVLVRGDVPDVVLVPDDNLRLDLLDVLHVFVGRFEFDVVSNVLFAVGIAVHAVPLQLICRKRRGRDDVLVVVAELLVGQNVHSPWSMVMGVARLPPPWCGKETGFSRSVLANASLS